MNKIFNTIILVTLLTFNSFSQDCETIVKACKANLKANNGTFLSDGQIYTAFLDREKAEFKTTFFGGSTYRISASAGTEDNFVIFTIKDLNGKIIFTNKNYKNSPYWDFKIPTTIPVIIETELDLDKKITGCAVMLIGFKQ
jgi:hypothetical protein